MIWGNAILRFRQLLEAHGLGKQILATLNDKLIDRGLMRKTGTVVDATLIAEPRSTKNDIRSCLLLVWPFQSFFIFTAVCSDGNQNQRDDSSEVGRVRL